MTIVSGGHIVGQIINFAEQKEKFNKQRSDLIPLEEWDGECWKTMFDTLAEMLPDNNPWDNLATFIKETLIK